jgi:cytochrome c-type biogenesis protein CcmH
LLGGVLVIGVMVSRRRGQRTADTDDLSDEERQRLAHLLDKNHE